MYKRKGRRDAGITVIEVMIVVAILAVLVALAAPNLSELFIRNRLDTAANDFTTALNLARSEAIRRGVPVTIRRSSTTAQEWTQGWEVFVDANGNSLRDAGEELIRVRQPLTQPLTLRSGQAVVAALPFTADGRLKVQLLNQPGHRGTFILCYDNARVQGNQSRSRAVLVSATGLIRPGVDTNGNGIPEDESGSDIPDCRNP
jgi:type IV fimbrial biogenesis protein FimT